MDGVSSAFVVLIAISVLRVECYPASFSTSGFVEDDDEEADTSKMDMSKKRRLRRWDFETDEEWERYREQLEALPKAAFQFGGECVM